MKSCFGKKDHPHHESKDNIEYSVITEMQEFVEDLADLLSYASVVKGFKNNPEIIHGSINKIIDRATHVKEMYIKALQTESTNELKSRKEAIFDEIDALIGEMVDYEIILDSYLVFYDDGLPLKHQFGNHALIISDSTDC